MKYNVSPEDAKEIILKCKSSAMLCDECPFGIDEKCICDGKQKKIILKKGVTINSEHLNQDQLKLLKKILNMESWFNGGDDE